MCSGEDMSYLCRWTMDRLYLGNSLVDCWPIIREAETTSTSSMIYRKASFLLVELVMCDSFIFSSNCFESVRINFAFALFTCLTLAADPKSAASVFKLVIFLVPMLRLPVMGTDPSSCTACALALLISPLNTPLSRD